MATPNEEFAAALIENGPQFGVELPPQGREFLTRYYSLVMHWNPRLHLVAPCSPKEFATRHVLESLMLLKHLPPKAAVADIGSGAGLPIIPCLLVRNDLQATLIESSRKKVVFLREALRMVLPADRRHVEAGRFAEIPPPLAGFVTCRALDSFTEQLPAMLEWAHPGATFLLFAGESLRKQVESLLVSVTAELIPGSERRFLIRGQRGP